MDNKPKGTFAKLMSSTPPVKPEDQATAAKKEIEADDTTTPRYHETNHGITVSRHHDTSATNDDIYEVVRKAVKQIGKEAATYRYTTDEKNFLSDVKYTYKRQGVLTSENEVTRIAINYFAED